ncbi:MAG TPA: Clp protease N-terminal domain-containing protein [Terracidiphilus sp.]|nr:Clp protease N-terminal domain-containing protein [Terracidiphilus sp.]
MNMPFTEEAKRAIFFAQYESNRSTSPSVETEHLLLGILRENPAFLGRFRVSESLVRDLIHTDEVSDKGASELCNLPLTDQSKNVLGSAKDEASRMSSKNVGIEHLLLGLLHEDCNASRILHKCGLSLDRIRTELIANPHHPQSDDARLNREDDKLERIISSISDQFHHRARNDRRSENRAVQDRIS